MQNEFETANEILDASNRVYSDKNRLLYALQKGTVLHLLEKRDESNQFFEDAYQVADELRARSAAEAVALFTNPQVAPYKGEDFEIVQIHYYKAINYLAVGDLESALVECRRLNNLLNRLNDRYEKKKNRYRVDAFALLIMGLVFDAAGEYNDAFIAYRNAYDAYNTVYAKHFGVQPPEQLKNDLLRTAYLNGFDDELDRFEKQFGRTYEHADSVGGDLIVFWHTGLGPVKDEWSINFLVVHGEGGAVFFVNEALGLSFAFTLDQSGSGKSTLGDLRFVRVAFPRYRERKPYFQTAEITAPDKRIKLEPAQNINSIAYATLEDRMVRDLSVSLLRVALKQASEYLVRRTNENLAALLSIANALTERADTRNWQTLPYAVHYARVSLPAGRQNLNLVQYAPRGATTVKSPIAVDIADGETVFHIVHQLDSYPLGN